VKERIIYENRHIVVLPPFWVVWPFETMVVPKRFQNNITNMTEDESLAFADAISKRTIAYDKLFDCSFPYSSGIHQAPTDNKSNEHWHWHMSF
jgi:UDPglucose--hexose-1-phosphate uridylyltransferase